MKLEIPEKIIDLIEDNLQDIKKFDIILECLLFTDVDKIVIKLFTLIAKIPNEKIVIDLKPSRESVKEIVNEIIEKRIDVDFETASCSLLLKVDDGKMERKFNLVVFENEDIIEKLKNIILNTFRDLGVVEVEVV